MDIEQHLTLLENKNKRLFGSIHLLCLSVTLSLVVLLCLFMQFDAIVTGIIVSIFTVFGLFMYVGYAIRCTNNRISLLHTKIKYHGK